MINEYSAIAFFLVSFLALAVNAADLGQIHTHYPASSETKLVTAGEPDFVVAAPRGWYRELAKGVVRAVLGRDDAARIIDATAEPPLDRTHVITIGCMAENPLLFRLYWNKYTEADLITPGPGKARVEVICDPYPWCARKNIIVLGGSDEVGVKVALEHFKSILRKTDAECSYPWELYRSNAQPVSPSSLKLDDRLTFQTFNRLAGQFVQTTNDACAEKAFEALEKLCNAYDKGGREGFTYAEESASPTTFYLWDVLEHHPSLQPEQRRRYADLLYSVLLRGLPSHTYEWKDLAAGPKLVWNHTGCPLFGIYVGARYFHKHYPETGRFTADALARCENAFCSQMRVWKTREDAHHYYQLGFRTVMGYSAGEWRLDYIENGNLKKMADYAIVTGDNMGGAANFGDAEAIRSNATEINILDQAFAWLPDPGYLWRLRHISSGTWRNRYHRDLIPQPPARLAGIRVVPMARTIYDLHNGNDAYGGAIPPSEVPQEKAFDKLSFRDSFDPMGQYLLIDGFSSGMHMHYDANMIVRFADRGRVWLMDDDYLVRQTTDHSGVSLLRNGRNAERMPVYASLEGIGDFDRVGLSRTRLPNYNGADWTRDCFWRKGRYLLIRDEITPRKKDDFLTFNVLKLYDRGRVEFGEDGALRSTQPEASVDQPEATLTIIPAADREVSLARRRSVSGDIPSVRLIEHATSSDGKPVVFRNLLFVADALETIQLEMRALNERYVAVRGNASERQRIPALSKGKPYAFDIAPNDRYQDTDQHCLTDGIQPVAANIHAGWVAWYCQSPAVTIDLGREEKAATVGAQVMGGDQWGIKFPTLVSLELAGNDGKFAAAGELRPHWPEKGGKYSREVVFKISNRPARQIRLHFDCAPDGFVFIGEIWASGGQTFSEPAATELDAIIGSGRLSLSGLEADADLAYLSSHELAFVNARSCKIDGIAVKAKGPTSVKLADLPYGDRLSASMRGVIKAAFAGGSRGRFKSAAPAAYNIATSYQCDSGEAVQMHPVADGKEGLVVGTGKMVVRLDSTLKEVWRSELPALVTSVGAGDLDSDGETEIFAGTVKELLHCLDDKGEELWRWEVQPKILQWAGWNGKARVEQIRVADVNGDGEAELVLGTKNSWLLALDGNRNTLWKYGYVYHGCRDIQIADLDRDGEVEAIAANRYGSVTRHNGRTGQRLATYATELGDAFVACAERPFKGSVAVLSGSTTGRFRAFDVAGKELWSFNNAGFGALDADVSAGQVWLGSESGLLYALNPKDGSAHWSRDFGAAVVYVLPTNGGVIVLDSRGRVWEVAEERRVKRIASVAARPVQAFLTDRRLYVLTAEGLFLIAI